MGKFLKSESNEKLFQNEKREQTNKMASEYRNNNSGHDLTVNHNSYGFQNARTGSFRSNLRERTMNRVGGGGGSDSSNHNNSSIRNGNSNNGISSNRYSSGANKSNEQSNSNNKLYYSSTKSFLTKITKSNDTNKLMGQPKAINSFNYGGYNNNNNNNNVKKQQCTPCSGTSSIESITPKYNGGYLGIGSTKRVYSSMRITKKENPYLTSCQTVNRTNVMDNYNSNATNNYVNSKKYTFTNSIKNETNNDKIIINNNNKGFETKRNKPFYASSRLCGSNGDDGSIDIGTGTVTGTTYSTKFPNGLPFEDEFYHRKRQNSVSSTPKSELSDYGSFDNDSDHSLLPFEDEYSHRRPSTEALYVDFSKPINSFNSTLSSKSTKHYTNGGNGNGSQCSSGNISCSSNSESNLTLSKPFNDFNDYSCKNYVCNPDEVIIHDQPVVYVAVQLSSNKSDLNKCETKRNDIA